MKKAFILFALVVALAACGGAQSGKQTAAECVPADVTQVLYFHGKQRCVTCNAIEKLTREVVDSLADKKIVMRIIDISDPDNEALADKYEVSWSSLLLDRDGKVENLTKTGFGYAKDQPGIFKKKLSEALRNIAQ